MNLHLVSLFTLLPLLCQCLQRDDNHINSFTGHADKHHEKEARRKFERFLKQYRKGYVNNLSEKELRYSIFVRNLMTINWLNENERGTAKYGITAFADLTKEEFRAKFTGFRPDLLNEKLVPNRPTSVADIPLPRSFDWRNVSGVVTAVKNQGMCGSCWAFSATGNIEGQWVIKKKSPISLSEQELVDCDKLDEGCNGGFPVNAYKTVIKIGGLETETEYPYHGRNEKCHVNKTLPHASIDSYVNLPQNETQLAQWLLQNGPISIGINANAMQFYFGGISHPYKWMCNPQQLDHGVLLVGFGVGKTKILKRTLPYWIVKNSWGSSWGEKGYYRVYRGDGTCGLNRMASSAWINE